MPLQYRLTVNLNNSYARILDIKYDLSVFHLQHSLLIKTFKSSRRFVYQVKCVDKEYNILLILGVSLT